MKVNQKLRLVLMICVLGTVVSNSLATSLIWGRVGANNTRFDRVAIDSANNVFAVGQSYRFPTQELLMTKYSPTGSVLWTQTLSDWPASDLAPTSCTLDSAGDLYVTYRRGSFGSYRAVLVKRSGATGVLLWFKELEAPSGDWVSVEPADVVVDSSNSVHVTYTRSRSNGVAQPRYRKYASGGTLLANDFNTTTSEPLGIVSDTFVTPAGHTYFRFGGDPNYGPTTAKVFRYPMSGWNPSVMEVNAHIAYSPVGGGHILGIGLLSNSSYRVYRMNLATNQITTRDFATAFNFMRLNKVAADADGNMFLAMGGSFNGGVTFEGRRVRFSYPAQDIAWSVPAGFNEDEFKTVALDRFGTSFFGGINPRSYAFNFGTGFVHVADMISGGLKQEIAMSSYDQVPADLAVNSRGFAAYVGHRRTANGSPTQGFVWLIGQSGLMNITVPGTEFTGGQTIDATVRRYAGTGTLSVNLASDSTFANIPSSASFGSGSTSVLVPVTLGATAVDRFVTLTATEHPMNRRVKFILKAPRPTSLVLAPASLTGGAISTATVTMNGNAPSGGIRLNLASTNSFAVVPTTALVPINQNRVNFTVTTTRPATTQSATISATYIGVTRSATLTILP